MFTFKDLLQKYKKMLIYILCSGASAIIETVLLLIFRRIFHSDLFLLGIKIENIVLCNTVAIFCGSVFHYIITSDFVFRVKKNFVSVLIYILTFLLGLGIQNVVIWLIYNKYMVGIIPNDDLRAITGKVLSLATSFFVTYFVRSTINKKFAAKKRNKK